MKLIFTISTLGLAVGQGLPKTTGGTGPYSSHYFADPGLPNHVIYQPKNVDGLKIPVVVWGNGACASDGVAFQAFLGQVASHGVMLISPGPLTGGSMATSTTAKMMVDSIDWITENAGRGNYSHVDASRLAAWGQSCGGLEAYSVSPDPRVGSVGIYDSGEFTEAASKSVAGNITKPIFYFMGGSTDIAYQNAERDYAALPKSTPAWKANNNLGHMSSFINENAGMVGTGGAMLAQWLLRGNETASYFFKGDGAKAAGYLSVVSQNLDSIKVTPIQ